MRPVILWLLLAASLSAQTTQTVTTAAGDVITVTVTIVTPPAVPVVPPPVVVEPPPVVVEPPPVVIPPPPAPPDPSTFMLVQKESLVWIGAFKLPATATGGALYSQGALAYNAKNNSLFVGGLSGETLPQWAFETSIPEITTTAANTGTVLQKAADVFEGKRFGDLMGGLFVYHDRLIATSYVYYGADQCGYEHYSHFAGSLDLSVIGDVIGPLRVETTGLGPKACTGLRAGFVAGYMADIPKAWQAALGGPVFTGGCCHSIIERTSFGPTVSVFDPDDIGVQNPVSATMLLGYPIDHADKEGLGPLAFNKATGNSSYSWSSEYFNGTTVIGGVVFPEHTRTVLFFGKHGPGDFCYGDQSLTAPVGSMHPTLHGTVCFVGPDAGHSPYSTSDHGTKLSYRYQVWAYDALDLAKVKAGTLKPWQVLPYAIWTPPTPISEPGLPNGSQTSGLMGAAYDARTGNIYVYHPAGSGRPTIDVYRVQ